MGRRLKQLAELQKEHEEQTAEWERVRAELRQIAEAIAPEQRGDAPIDIDEIQGLDEWLVTEFDPQTGELGETVPASFFFPRSRG